MSVFESRLSAACNDLTTVFNVGCTFHDPEGPGNSFTCDEADALAGLFRAVGLTDLAEDFLEQHGNGDEAGDSHVTYRATR